MGWFTRAGARKSQAVSPKIVSTGGLTEFVAMKLLTLPEVCAEPALCELAGVYASKPSDMSVSGEKAFDPGVAIAILKLLASAIQAALKTFAALYTRQKEIAKANKEVGADMLLKLRYVEKVANAYLQMHTDLDALGKENELTRAFLLRLANALETFCYAEAKHGNVKNNTVWEQERSKLIDKKFYMFLRIFYEEFNVLARDLTQHNARAMKEIQAAKQRVMEAWFDDGPAAHEAYYRLLEGARAIDCMAAAVVAFEEDVRNQ